MARYLDIHPVNPQPRLISQTVNAIREGSLIAYPTDSGYAIGGLLGNQEVKNRILQLRGLDDRHHFTLLCADFGQLGQLVHIDNAVYRAIKASTPGRYTFILPATKEVPRRLQHPKKKTVGVRIPEHPVALALLAELGEPLLTSTLILPGQSEPMADGWQINEEVGHLLDIVLDSGECGSEPTTVINFTEGYPEVERAGAGSTERFE